MDIGDIFNVDETSFKVANIVATWRLTGNYDYKIYFQRTLEARTPRLSPSKNHEDFKLIQINETDAGIMYAYDATFCKANLSTGDTIFLNSTAYRMTSTEFDFFESSPNYYWMYHNSIRV